MKFMPLVECLRTLSRARTNEVVVTAMGTAREWSKLSSHPLDWTFVPSSMGQATSLGLGIALARPERKVIVCNGDGSTLMNLGSLVTITAQSPENLIVLVFVNGVYEVTGGQQTPAAASCRADGRDIDFCSLAQATGFTSIYEFQDLERWQMDVESVIAAKGPTFAVLWVAPLPEAGAPSSPGPGKQRAVAFIKNLANHA